jgi:D-tyrosyl-tRNA(Tyr) deacylase
VRQPGERAAETQRRPAFTLATPVAQFTLYCRLKGNKRACPGYVCRACTDAVHAADFSQAMPPQAARDAYASLVARLRSAYRPEAVHDGVFGAMMQVELVNDGPVSLILDSQSKE